MTVEDVKALIRRHIGLLENKPRLGRIDRYSQCLYARALLDKIEMTETEERTKNEARNH